MTYEQAMYQAAKDTTASCSQAPTAELLYQASFFIGEQS